MESLQQSFASDNSQTDSQSVEQYVFYNTDFYSESTIEEFKSESHPDDSEFDESMN